MTAAKTPAAVGQDAGAAPARAIPETYPISDAAGSAGTMPTAKTAVWE